MKVHIITMLVGMLVAYAQGLYHGSKKRKS